MKLSQDLESITVTANLNPQPGVLHSQNIDNSERESDGTTDLSTMKAIALPKVFNDPTVLALGLH
jgi:hypothetical protein